MDITKTRVTFTAAELDALIWIVSDTSLSHAEDDYSDEGVTLDNLHDKLTDARHRVTP